MLGATVIVPMLTGEMKLKVPGSQSGKRFRLKEK